ncbi:MAG TPA: ABC transporter permease [Acidobacteriota bacterium]|nr:ABC transporter permease [Acidobacteriota bacterium]
MASISRKPLWLARRLVGLFPVEFRREYGREVLRTLDARAREVRERPPHRRLLFWTREYRSLLLQALKLHLKSPRQGRLRRQIRPTRWNMLRSLPVDLKRTFRGLSKRPGFTALAVITLALGIGANTAIFSLVDQVMLRSLPFPDAERLMMVWFHELDDIESINTATPADFAAWRDQVSGYEAISAYYYSSHDLHAEGSEPESIRGIAAWGDLLGVLGVEPAYGRSWTPEEGRQVSIANDDRADDRPGVIVLSDTLAARLYGSPREAVGEELRLSGRLHTVLGVMPPGFYFPSPQIEAWMPVQLTPRSAADHTQYLFRVLLRLPDSAGARQRLQSAYDELAQRLQEEYPAANGNAGIRLMPLQDVLVSDVRDSLVLLWMAVAAVLLVACVNLANLMLVRNMGRTREMAVRKALGAGRWQTLWQSLLESLTLAASGGAAGVLLAWLGLDAVKALAPSGMPRLEEVAIDQRVLLFSLGLSLAAGVVFGILPALRISRQDPASALAGGRTTSGGRSASRFQRGLVVAEVALSVVLLIAAGLTLRSFQQVVQQHPGYEPEGLLAVTLSVLSYRYPERTHVNSFFQRVIEETRALPGVASASYSSVLPLSGGRNSAWLQIRERPHAEGQTPPSIYYRVAGRDLFKTLKIPLKRGRTFQSEDRPESPPVAVVNEAFFERYLAEYDHDPLSTHISLGPVGLMPWTRVVGIVGDVRNQGLDQDTRPAVFLLREQLAWDWRHAQLIVRSAPGTLDSTRAQLRDMLQRIDPQIPVYRIRTVEQDIARSLDLRRSVVLLLTSFAILALVLSAVGLFGVVSFTVGRRVPEIGIRMALGAAPSRIRRWVLRNGLAPVLIGLVLGLAASSLLRDLLSTQLYGVTLGDPLTLSAVTLGLLLVAALACWHPARRATRTDPVQALRTE